MTGRRKNRVVLEKKVKDPKVLITTLLAELSQIPHIKIDYATLADPQTLETIPEIKRMAKEAGRNPENIEFSVLMMAQGEGPAVETMKRYQDAGVSRMIVLAWAAASGSGVEAVKGLAPIVERAQKV